MKIDRGLLPTLPLLLLAAAPLKAGSDDPCLQEPYFVEHRVDCSVADPAAREELKAILAKDLDDAQEATLDDALAKRYPKEPYLELWAAATDGDAARGGPGQAAGAKAAVDRLQKVLETQKGMHPFLIHFAQNELFFQSGNCHAQYILGLAQTQSGWPFSGGYSMGVGASVCAYDKLKDGRLEEARDFAQKSLAGWRQRYQGDAAKMGREFYFIQSVAISGDVKKAMAIREKNRREEKDYDPSKPDSTEIAQRLAEIKRLLNL